MGSVVIPVAEVLATVLGLVLLAPGVLLVRRRLLTRGLGSFDCSLRHETVHHRGHWIHGIARYGDDRLDWFRVFALGLRAAESLARQRLVILDSRQPELEERHSVLPGWVVVRCGYGSTIVELAMSEGAFNGLAAWLESAPPGQHVSSVA
ncbi:MAG TPA: DUF2550 domain-containing protein [Kineosporiaceae bacterium]